MKIQSLTQLVIGAAIAVAFVGPITKTARADDRGRVTADSQVMHRTIQIDDLEIFYREAGPKDAPTLLLLHGFPTSSHMFRNLIPALADRYHVVAPDYPGFGFSSAPSVEEFEYSFDNLARVIQVFTERLKLDQYSLYVMDYGAPVGFRLATAHPERVQTLIIQNGTPTKKA
ncbi:alpha/beta fold hydrolase, partial [Rhodopirellula baltica]|uniref:alpha/beta fold hydrolase n=1 Tax=Rhodopirellula baltica TaxID=265606 RepID=UPI0005655855